VTCSITLLKTCIKKQFIPYPIFYSTEILYPDCFVVLLQFQRGEQCHQHIINSLILERGLKALFRMYKCFEGHKPKIKTLLPVYVFDHTVKPILTYGTDQIIILIQREPQTKECLYY
jgi:hypothetical protein